MNRDILRVRPQSDRCTDPRWLNLPTGGAMGTSNYNYGKRNYCDRCKQGTGSFPISWSPTGRWQYNPTGTDYCSCCNGGNPRTVRGRVQISQMPPRASRRRKARFTNVLNINRNIYNL